MNLRRQAVAYFSETKPRPEYAAAFEWSVTKLGQGESFLMPHGGYLFDANKEASIDLKDLHLPFDVCALEWTKNEPEIGKFDVVCIAREFEEHFEIAPTMRAQGVWYPICLVLKVPKSQIFETYRSGDGFLNRIAAEPIPITPYAPVELIDGANYLHEVKVVAQFLLAANCGNVSPVKIHEPSARQAKAALARGNPPFDSYWTLDCSLDETDSAATLKGGSHNPPRLHVRRGHIRHLPTGKLTWVRQCLVGNPDRGIVEKDYRTHAQ